MSADAATTRLVREALDGDPASLNRLVVRLSPWLLAQARYRLGEPMRRLYDPEDLVHDVWLAALPRLASVGREAGRRTPALVKYLSATLLYRLQNLIEKHLAGKPAPLEPSRKGDPDRLADSVTGAFSEAVLRERKRMVWSALEGLEDRDRALIVLRGIEQHPVGEIAVVLGISANAVSVGYRRACQKLRGRLEARMLDDLPPG